MESPLCHGPYVIMYQYNVSKAARLSLYVLNSFYWFLIKPLNVMQIEQDFINVCAGTQIKIDQK